VRYRFVSQYAGEVLGLAVYDDGVLTDAISPPTVRVWRELDEVDVVSAGTASTRDALGLYSFQVGSAQTKIKGIYGIEWLYSVASTGGPVAREFVDHFEVVDPMPYWDMLSAAERDSVMNIYHKVSDTFDSREGGPYLWELYQTQWNAYETIARLMATDALTYINLGHQPAIIPGFAVGSLSSKPFPVAWAGLLELSTYVQFLRHISRSYIEIPTPQGVSTARLDRTRYRAEWDAEYKIEKATLDQILKQFKRKYLLGTSRAMLIGGGNIPFAFANLARPHWKYSVSRY
jgi:hypothetical protein